MALNVERDVGRNRWRMAVWGILAALMLLPMFASVVTDEMNWNAFDFVLFGALLLGAGVTYELAARITSDPAYLAGAGIAVAAAFLLIVVTGAVGIIGSEDEDANLMFGGVIAVGVVGAIIARFQPEGMARAMVATAISQALVAVIAIAAGFGSSSDTDWPRDILGVTAIFVALWLGSSWLFWWAARRVHTR